MFEFIFGKKPVKTAAKESLRQTGERSLEELNAILATLPETPAITLRAGGAGIEIDWPDQFPDEAKALPAPAASDGTEPARSEVGDDETKAG